MNQKKSLMKCHVSKSVDCKNILKNIQSFPLLWLYSVEAKKSKREDPRNNEVALDLLIAIRSCNLLLWGGTPENLSGGVLPRVVKILTLFQT